MVLPPSEQYCLNGGVWALTAFYFVIVDFHKKLYACLVVSASLMSNSSILREICFVTNCD